MFLNNVEKKILNRYINTYANGLKMDRITAEGTAKANIIKAKETAIREGLYNLPPDYWKEIFKMEKDNIDNYFTSYYKRARKDGVKDEDIIYLWETYPVESYLMQETQNSINMYHHLRIADEGKSLKETVEFVRKNFPTYGNPLIKLDYGGDEDNPLPLEFIFKVTKLLSSSDAPKLRKEAQKFSSFNAFVRYLAKEDRLGKN